MNLFIRYFNHETLAHTVDEAMYFLSTIGEFKVDNSVLDRVSDFFNSSNTYPFRLKVSFSNYVLFLKTEAETVEEFHILEQENRAVKLESKGLSNADKKRMQLQSLSESNPGWYEGTIVFKRVVIDEITNKCRYIDTPFTVRCKADSPMECYTRIIDHLKSRPELDPRCQFPSVRSSSFIYKFVGES